LRPLLNVDGYYDPLLENGRQSGYPKDSFFRLNRDLLISDSDPERLLDRLRQLCRHDRRQQDGPLRTVKSGWARRATGPVAARQGGGIHRVPVRLLLLLLVVNRERCRRSYRLRPSLWSIGVSTFAVSGNRTCRRFLQAFPAFIMMLLTVFAFTCFSVIAS